MALIRQLKSFLAKTNIYPKTLTSAVYDNEGNRLDNKLGAASLSGYADGTITGAVKSACDDVETLKSDVNQINSNLNNKILHLTINTNGYELKSGSMYCVAWRSAVDQGLINACDRVYYLDDYIPQGSGFDRNNSFMISACATSQSGWGSESVGYQKQFTSDIFIFKVNSNDVYINMIITLCKR